MTIDRVFDLYAQCLLHDFVPSVPADIRSVAELPAKRLFEIAKQLEYQMNERGFSVNQRRLS